MNKNPFSQPAQSAAPVANPFATAKPNKSEVNAFGFGGASESSRPKQNKRKENRPDANEQHGLKRKGGRPPKERDHAQSDNEVPKKKRGDAKQQRNGLHGALMNGTAGTKKLRGPTKNRQENGQSGADATDASRPTSSSSASSSVVEDNSTLPASIPKTSDPHARKVFTQLHKDGIGPPSWPSKPGDPRNKATMAKFREKYENYRTAVRASLTKAGLIDDPNKRRTLENAIDFRGICEDMCPEFEKIMRITELDVHGPEKNPDTGIASTQRMVKKLARSAAGQEAPLPMDVRSVPALRRTLDYLIDDLLKNDDNLPGLHGFLWDRTRAIRRDFTFFSSLSPEELKTQVYVLENIARFHVTALHLLSKSDVKPEDFVEQQELEQLGKALLSLRDVYDDCNEQGITCENEAQFRAYYLVFHAKDPNVMDIVSRQWSPRLWKDSDEVRTAVSLVEALQNTKDFHGPLKPAPALAAAGPLHSYFRIVEDESVSYTLACFAETHFAALRRSMLGALARGLARPKEETKDVTAEALNNFLRFDTVEEAIEFAELHDLEFEADPADPTNINRKRLVLRPRQQIPHIRLQHQYSEKLVERKRGSRALPEVIHRTVFANEASDSANKFTSQKTSFNTASQTTTTNPAVNGSLGAPAAPKSFFNQPSSNTNGSLFMGAGNGGTVAQTQPPNFSFKQQQPLASSPFSVAASSSAPTEKPTLNASASPFAAPSPAVPTSSEPAKAADVPKPNPFANFPPSQPPTTNVEAPKLPSLQGDKVPSPFAVGTLAETPTAALQPNLNVSKPPTLGSLAPKSLGQASLPGLLAPSTSPFQAPSQSSPFSQKKPETGAIHAPTPTGLEKKTDDSAPKEVSYPTLPSIGQQTEKAPGASVLGLSSSISTAAPSLPAFPITTPATTITATPAPTLTALAPVKPASPPPPPRDLMGDFTKWIVQGDRGLLEEFQEYFVGDLVKDVFTKFVKDREEEKRKAEEDAANAEADRWRKYNLGLKFFYRWKRNARAKRLRFIRRSGRDQMREYWETKRREEKEAKAEEARKAARAKKEEARLANIDHAAEIRDVVKRRKINREQATDDLLASGVLSGVKDERGAAARIVQGDNFRRTEPRPGSSTMGPPSKPITKEGAKTRALREQLLGGQAGFRRSLPPLSSKSSDSSPPSKDVSRVSERWRLKAMGFVYMPDGSVLPESIANEVLSNEKRLWTGARASSYGHSALNVSQAHASSMSRPRASSYSTPHYNKPIVEAKSSQNGPSPRHSLHESSSSQKRKRSSNNETDDVAVEENDESSRPHKRTVSDLVDIASKVRRQHQEMKALLDDMMADDLSERLQSEINSRGSTPWRDGT